MLQLLHVDSWMVSVLLPDFVCEHEQVVVERSNVRLGITCEIFDHSTWTH